MIHPLKQQGFTLVELLVATSLSAVLMAAVLQVANSIRQDNAAMQQPDLEPAWFDGLIDVITTDLQSAREHVQDSNQFTITTLGLYHPLGHQRHGGPVIVSYAVEAEHNILLRVQTDQTQALAKPIQSLMAVGVKSFELAAMSTAQDQATAEPADDADSQPALNPTAYRLSLLMTDGSKYERIILLA